MPRFDLPGFTRPIADVLTERGVVVDPQDPLPVLREPPPHRVVDPGDEPLVPITHRQIRTLANYWHAGWEHAVPATLARSGVMRRLALAAQALPRHWGFAVFDAWRPLSLQNELYTSAYSDPDLPAGFLAEPSTDPSAPPPHLTGGAVDLTLTIDGVALALGCGFDDATEAAHAAYLESEPGPAREARRLLYRHMHEAGFIVFEGEWWHFEYGTTRWSGITGHPPIYGPASPRPSQPPSVS